MTLETARQPLLAEELFVGIERVAHLCTGGAAPWLRSHVDAEVEQFFAVLDQIEGAQF